MSFKICHISHSDIHGGASIAAFRLHQAMLSAQMDSRMFVLVKNSDLKSITSYNYHANVYQKFIRKNKQIQLNRVRKFNLERRSMKTAFTDDRANVGSHLIEQIPESNIVHLHWIAGMIDYSLLSKHFQNKKSFIVWTLHDLAHVTGGCHYPYNCQHYLDHCHQCPQLDSTKDKDWSFQIFKRKKSAFESISKKTKLIAPSLWTQKVAAKSALLKNIETVHIPYCIDMMQYKVLKGDLLRSKYKFDPDCIILLFISGNIQESRKGFHEYIAALKILLSRQNNLKLTALVVGNNMPDKLDSSLDIRHINFVSNSQQIIELYNLADASILPTIADTGPQTALESIACGTPIIGYNTGIIGDILFYPDMGVLCRETNPQSLSLAIEKFLENRKKFNRNTIRETAIKHFDLKNSLSKHKQFYQDVSANTK